MSDARVRLSVHAVLVALVCFLGALGCGRDGGQASGVRSQGSGPDAEEGQGKPRIICMMPAVSKMIVDLGRGDDLVGVGQWDSAAPEGVPVVGHFASVDYERVIALEPTLVITVDSKESPPDRLVKLAEQMGFELVAYPNPLSVADVADMLWDEDRASDALPPIGRLLGEEESAAELRAQMLARLAEVEEATSALPTRRVLLCLSTTPNVMASGEGTTHDGLLRYVNATNAVAGHATGGITAPTFDRESLAAMAPEVIVLLMPGAPPLAPNDERLAVLRGLDLPAVRDGRVVLINDPQCLLPSTSLPRLADRLAEAIHGEAYTEARGD